MISINYFLYFTHGILSAVLSVGLVGWLCFTFVFSRVLLMGVCFFSPEALVLPSRKPRQKGLWVALCQGGDLLCFLCWHLTVLVSPKFSCLYWFDLLDIWSCMFVTPFYPHLYLLLMISFGGSPFIIHKISSNTYPYESCFIPGDILYQKIFYLQIKWY